MTGPFVCPMEGGLGMWAMMIFVAIFLLLLLIGIVLLIVWLVSRTRPTAQSPLDILSRRYAQGEISHEDYERMKQEISAGGG